MGADVSVGAYCVIGDGVRIGDGTVIHPHVVVYAHAVIGPACEIHSHATVREHVRLGGGVILQNGAVVGADGFGFAPRGDGSYEKIVQAGTVVLEDDVEVQANACVDRATVGRTTIGKRSKVDNLVQVGHGCSVGEDTLLCGQAGLAGSTDVGDRVILTGQVGVAGHCRIVDDVILTAQSGVNASIEEPGIWSGTPALPVAVYRRVAVNFRRLPDIADRLKKLERRVPQD
jgi:UDP-3-O-[3-hydroxymyristoyl] glucosamine N-acyltransferase